MSAVNFVSNHSTVLAIGAFYFFSVMVSSMPEPNAASKPQYVYWYKVLHGFAGVLTSKFGPVPQAPPAAAEAPKQ